MFNSDSLTKSRLSSLCELTVCVCVQPPPRRPLNFAEAHENEEEKQFRRIFQQLAGDVSSSHPPVFQIKPVCSGETEGKFPMKNCSSSSDFKLMFNQGSGPLDKHVG